MGHNCCNLYHLFWCRTHGSTLPYVHTVRHIQTLELAQCNRSEQLHGSSWVSRSQCLLSSELHSSSHPSAYTSSGVEQNLVWGHFCIISMLIGCGVWVFRLRMMILKNTPKISLRILKFESTHSGSQDVPNLPLQRVNTRELFPCQVFRGLCSVFWACKLRGLAPSSLICERTCVCASVREKASHKAPSLFHPWSLSLQMLER